MGKVTVSALPFEPKLAQMRLHQGIQESPRLQEAKGRPVALFQKG